MKRIKLFEEFINEAYSGSFKVGDKVWFDGDLIPKDIQWEIRKITKGAEPTFYLFSVLNPKQTVQVTGDEDMRIWDKKDGGQTPKGKGDFFSGYFR